LGDSIIFPEAWDIEEKGDMSEFIIGFEQKAVLKNPSWVDDSTSPWLDVMTALSVTPTSAQPAAFTAMGLLDFTVRLICAKTTANR